VRRSSWKVTEKTYRVALRMARQQLGQEPKREDLPGGWFYEIPDGPYSALWSPIFRNRREAYLWLHGLACGAKLKGGKV